MVFVPPQSGVSGAARFLGGCGNACLEGPALDWLLPPRCNLRVFRPPIQGEMAEWLKAHAWKACIGETLSRVRIPLSPPDFFIFLFSKSLRFVIGSWCR